MKVLALMGSPRAGSNTDYLIEKILAGASATGAKTEKFGIRGMHVMPCDGCMDCRKTGKCEKDDDVAKIADKIGQADVIVIGTPIYGNHLPGEFKIFFDRLTGLTHKSEMREGKLVSISRLPNKKRNLALLGVAGAPNHEACDQSFRYLSRVFAPELNGGEVFELRAISLNIRNQISMTEQELIDYVRLMRYPNVEETVEKMLLQNDEYQKRAYKMGKDLILSLKNS